jgi:purine nucleosidase
MNKPESNCFPQSVWLDTDIGDDTDDILALALICASPELTLAGVSTVWGDTAGRARLARTLLATLPEPLTRTPVAAGGGRPLPGSHQHHLEMWPNGPAPRKDFVQRACARPAAALPPAPRQHGVELLAAHLRAHPGQTVPIGIGAMTNLATLLLRFPETHAAIPRLALMAGDFTRGEWEWNVRCDPLAAAVVLESGLPIDFLPWEIGMACTVSAAQVKRLHASRTRPGRLISRAVRLWQESRVKRTGKSDRPHLYDPMAVAMVSHPEWFVWRRGRVRLSLAPQTFARTYFTPDPRGPHRVVWKIKRLRSVEAVWTRILSL